MARNSTGPLLAVVAALAAALAYFTFLRGDGAATPPAGVSPDAQVATAEGRDAAPATLRSTGGEARPSGAADGGSRAAVDTSERAAWTEGDLAGELFARVLLPPGTPADEQCVVVVRPFGQETAEGGPGEAFDVDRVPLDGEGRARLALPAAAARVRVAIDARYLVDIEPRWFDLPLGADAGAPDEVVLAPLLGAWLTGELRAPGSAPAPDWSDAAVASGVDFTREVSRERAEATAAVQRRVGVAPDGTFELRALVAGPAFGLTVDEPSLPIALVGGLVLAPGEHRHVTVDLEPGALLAGRVVDEAGDPVAGAAILVGPRNQVDLLGRQRSRGAASDADGRFTVVGVAAGALGLSATADGLVQGESLALDVTPGAVLEGLVVTLGRGATVAGVVLGPEGRPFAEAEVEVRFDPAAINGLNASTAAQSPVARVTSDEQGRFSASGLLGGPFQASASVEGGAEEQAAFLAGSVAGIAAGAADVELRLEVLPDLIGRVVDPQRAPVTTFTLDLWPTSLTRVMTGERVLESVEDPKGDFRLRGLALSDFDLYVTAEGFGAAGPIPVDRSVPANLADPLVIVLERGARILGRVVAPDGSPVAGASVEHRLASRDMVLGMLGVGSAVSERTAEDGSFALEGLPAGRLRLTVAADGWAPPEPVDVEVASGATIDDLVISLRTGGTIRGLFLEAGEPVAGALVQVQRPGGGDQRALRTDAEGGFLAEHLEPGTWQLVGIVNLDAGADAGAVFSNLRMKSVTVADGEEVEVLLGAEAVEPVLVRGRVEPPDAMAGGAVIFVPEGEDLLGRMKIGAIDASGRFEVELNGAGTHVVTVQPEGVGGMGQDQVEFIEEIPAGAEHVLVLRLPGGSVTGRVTDTSGQPLAGARVSLYAEGGASTGTLSGGKYAETTTSGDGTYVVRHLRPGTYQVGAGGAMLAAILGGEATLGRVVRSGIAVGHDEHVAGIDFELEEPGVLAGRLVDHDGRPVASGAVFVRDESGALLERISLVQSGSDGSFRYEGLAPGSYSAAARSETGVSVSSPQVRVDSGAVTELELVLAPGADLFVTILDDEGAPMQADVQVLDESGQEVGAQFGLADLMRMLQGEFSTTTRRFGPLPAGRYRVLASSGGADAKRTVNLEPGDERKLRMRLRE